MQSVIKVQNLSKKYVISHQSQNHGRYVALRDVIAENIKRSVKRLSGQYPRNSLKEDFWALKDINFEVKHGDKIGIIGHNGAGKSTLLKLLSRITHPTTGKIVMRGRVASLLEVGVGFHPELTGRENIFLSGAIYGMSRSEIMKRFDEIVGFAEIEQFLDTPVKRYSSGMYVRLAFAVAAHMESEILLVDEVLAVGDTEFQKKCLGKMGEVAKQNRTIFFVSHNMMAVRNLCSSALVLRQGRIEYQGDVSLAVDHYLNDKANISGEVSWDTPEMSPGDHQVRLKAVRIVSEGVVTGTPMIDREIEVQIDYWNLRKDSRRLVSIHVLNSLGMMLFSSSNLNMASTIPDLWAREKYPVGLFRTSCTIPASLLNNGVHNLNLYINGLGSQDVIIFIRNVISFEVKESGGDREYFGEWLGAVRPKLLWQTRQLE